MASVNNVTNNGGSNNWNHTVAAGNSLLVGVAYYHDPVSILSGARFNGVDMDYVDIGAYWWSGTEANAVKFFKMDSPPAGTYQVSLVTSGGPDEGYAAFSIDVADLGALLASNVGFGNNSVSISVASEAGEPVFLWCYAYNKTSVSSGAGQSRLGLYRYNSATCVVDLETAVSGSTSMSFSSSGAYFGAIAVAFEAPVTDIVEEVGQAAETDVALPVAVAKAATAGQASSSESALGVTGRKTAVVGLAEETAVALPVAVAKAATAGQAASSESALGVTSRKTAVVGLAEETDVALPVAVSKAAAVGQAASSENALGVTGRKTAVVGLAEETDAALPVAASKAAAVGQASSSESALGVTARKTAVTGLAEETDVALPVSSPAASVVGQAVETDTALPVVGVKTKTVGQASELSQALAVALFGQLGAGEAVIADVAVNTAVLLDRAASVVLVDSAAVATILDSAAAADVLDVAIFGAALEDFEV